MGSSGGAWAASCSSGSRSAAITRPGQSLATAAPARQAGGSSAITASSKPGVARKIREEAVTPRSSVNAGPARVEVRRIEHELHQIAHDSRTEELDPALALVGWGLAFVPRAREASPAGA